MRKFLIINLLLMILIIPIAYLGYYKINTNDDLIFITSNTIILYISADNDLSEYASLNLGLLKSIGSTENVNIVTLIDDKGDNNTKLNHVKLRSINDTPLNEMDPGYVDEMNMGDNSTLENFVIWSMDNYPADRYMLVLWGHGKDWHGVAPDGDDYLTMDELDSALNNIVEYNGGNKLDIIGFDA